MSALDIDWLRPVAPDGPTPLQTLVDWFAVNGVVYHASSHQREVLVPLCRDLNARGVQCEVDQILDYVSYLQEVVHDATALTHKLPADLQPYRERLQTLLFKDGHNDGSVALPSPQKRSTNRLSWLEHSRGGLSGMEVLVDWLKNNYATYARSSKKGEKGRMLEELVRDMKDAGIQDCAVNTVRAKIDVLHREVKGEKSRSAAWEQFGSVLEEIFTMGDAGQERDDNSDGEENGASGELIVGVESIQTETGHVNSVGIVTTSKPSVKHTRSSPTSRLSWMKQVLPGSPTAMELLVGWMERHYYDYTHTRKKGDKGRMLIKLLRKIEAAGHQGCTIHAIRVKIDSLQRQAGGKARPSSAFDQFGTSLRRVFAEKQGLEPRISPRSGDSSDDSQGSEEEMESDGETVTDTVKSPEFEADSALPRMGVDNKDTLQGNEVSINCNENDVKEPLNPQPAPVSLRKTKTRWICLLFACFTCVGDYYCANLTQALQHYIMEDFKINPLQFNTLSSVGSIPSIILPFIGGILVDRFGIRTTFACFSAVVILGQIVMTIGVGILHFELLIISKVIFAIGAGPLLVAKSAVLVKWFVGKELSFALGAALCVSRLGSSIDSIISPRVYTWSGNSLFAPFFVGVLVCIMSQFAVFSVNYLDKKLDKSEEEISKEPKKVEPFTLNNFKRFSKLFILIGVSVAFLYAGFFGFMNNLNDQMVNRFGFLPKDAGSIIPIIYLLPSCITPFFGTYVDRTGKRVLMILIAAAIFLASHLYVAWIPDSAPETSYMIIWGLLGVGLFYSIYAAVIWPCIALVVEEKLTGLAYGCVNSFQSLVMIFLPLLLGYINVETKETKHGYFWSQIVLAGVVTFGIIITVMVYILDLKHGGVLNSPGTERATAKVKNARAKSFCENE